MNKFILLGDIAWFSEGCIAIDDYSLFDDALVVANLEGAIPDGWRSDLSMSVYNHTSVLDVLHKLNVKAVSLANNHVDDLGLDMLVATKEVLKRNKISSFGAGRNIEEAHQVYTYGEYIFVAFGWDVIGCRSADNTNAGTAPMTRKNVVDIVSSLLKHRGDKKIVVMFHWNYENELYPQPAHRKLATDLIDAGVYAVVGGHSHIFSGVEKYKDRLIVYGMGNWLFPWNKFFSGRLKYSQKNKLQGAVEVADDLNASKVHWFEYCDKEQKLHFKNTEPLFSSTKIAELTPFSGMSHSEYDVWFKQNRLKKKVLPIYYSSDGIFVSFLKDKYVFMRQMIIDILVKFKLKGW